MSVLIATILGGCAGFANTFLQLNSTYLGGGWFQYDMHVMDDPFFTAVDLQINFDFTNQVACNSSSTDWTNDYSYNFSSYWASTQSYPPRPYDVTFLMQSTNTTYRLGVTNEEGALVLMSLYLSEANPGYIISGNVVGYAWVPCLIPCPPDQADGSPTNYSYALKLVSDISIQRLIATNNSACGVDFLWDSQSTLLLQASPDMSQWTNVAYIWSTPPETDWTTNTPLTDFGQFFRLELVANGYQTDLPPLGSNVILAQRVAPQPDLVSTKIPRVAGCRLANGKIAVNLVTLAKQNYIVQALNSQHKAVATQTVTAAGPSTTVGFAPAGLPTPVYFQVTAAP